MKTAITKALAAALLLLYVQTTATAQSAGIGTTTPDSSALLDVSSTTKGLLVPRMTTVQRTAIASPALGLLVFDTNLKQFTFRSDTGWVSIPVAPQSGSGGSASWTVDGNHQYAALSGNVGIGTTTPAGKLHVKGTTVIDSARIEFQNTAGSILIGQNAGAADLFTSGGKNIFVGTNAGQSFNSGESNIALGENALQTAGITVENIAIGKQALGNAAIVGAANIAIGSSSGLTSGGFNNIFVGQQAGATSATGNDNVIIGRSAGATIGPATGSRNVFIGLNAGQNETGSDKLYINSAATPGLPLIYGDFFNRLFRINGTLNINNNYSLPGTAGTNNFVLKSDGGGNTSWANVNTLVNSSWTSSGTNQYSSNTGNVGIGTTTPSTKLDVAGTTRTTAFQLPTGATAGHVLRSDASGNATWVNPNTIAFSESDPQVAASVADRIPKWNGTALTDGIIIDNGVNIGISTATPTTKLDVNGTTKTVGFQMPTGAVAGHILRTDEFGLGTWVNPNTITVNEADPQVTSATVSRVPRWNGTSLADGAIQDDAANVGIGTAPVAANKLTVVGKTQVDSIAAARFQMTNGANNGFVLQSDATGRAAWVNANTLTVNYTETDPQVTAATTNKVPKWNGTSLADGLIIDNGTNIGIGTATPADKLHVAGNFRIDAGRLHIANTGNATAIGENAGQSMVFAGNTKNTFIGSQAGKLTSTGFNNIAIGFNSFADNVTGGENVAIGELSLGNANNSYYNVAIGKQAAYNCNGAYNTVIGWEAGGIMQNNAEGNVYIGARAGYNIGGSNKLYIGNHISPALIYGDFSTGAIGLGTTNPTQAKLVVNGSNAQTYTSYGYLNRTHPTGTINGNTTPANYSIYASERIAAAEFNAYSDARIKNIKGISNREEDLRTLMGIEVTDYRLKDSVSKGGREYKKVIAQQVEKVYPQAVTQMTDVVPDIYQNAAMKNGVVNLVTTLKAGDKVKLIFESGEEMATVTAVTATSFTVDTNKSGKVFVFGKEVNDFRTVDYEALSTLNISATQELQKQLQRQQDLIDLLLRQVHELRQAKTVTAVK